MGIRTFTTSRSHTTLALSICLVAACAPREAEKTDAPANTVVIYCSVDTAFAEPILADFEKRTGIRVHRQFDTEAGKTTGLVNKLLAERANPRADVWWSSEIYGTLQLAGEGVLSPYRPATADDISDTYRDTNNIWTAFGLRGRVIAYNPKRVKPDEIPKRWADLTDPKYKGRVAMADPRFGTTRGHMATFYTLWGKETLSSYYENLRINNYRRADGNAHAVVLLSRGVVDFACTDTDDVIVAQERGDSIAMCYPDLDSPDGVVTVPGTLWIPCSVALVKGARHETAAKMLIDYIASADLERRLAASDSRNVPVRESLISELLAGAPQSPDADRPFSALFENPIDLTLDGKPKPFPYAAKVDFAAAAAALADSDALVATVLLK